MILLCLGAAGCSPSSSESSREPKVNGRWKVHLSSWIDPEHFDTLDLTETGGVITGTYTIKPGIVGAGTYAVHGVRAGKEIELLWTQKEADRDINQQTYDYSLKGTIEGDRMSGKCQFRTKYSPEIEAIAQDHFPGSLKHESDSLWVAQRE
jgi:hypothetical protein